MVAGDSCGHHHHAGVVVTAMTIEYAGSVDAGVGGHCHQCTAVIGAGGYTIVARWWPLLPWS